MYKIAIVEDESLFSEQLNGYIGRYSEQTGNSFEVKIYDRPLEFLDKFESNTDILFVDIKMPGMTGMEMVEALRKRDSELLIIFTTSYNQYAVKGYSVHAFDFLLKPIDYVNFSRTMNRAMTELAHKIGKCINIKSADRFVKVPVNKIKFIEVLGRQLFYYLSNGETVVAKGSLSE